MWGLLSEKDEKENKIEMFEKIQQHSIVYGPKSILGSKPNWVN